MPYHYISRQYGVSPQVGQRAYHKEVKRYGVILRPKPSAAHYVHIRFDGEKHGSLSHPMELEYLSDTEPV